MECKLTLATDSGKTRRMGRPPLKRNVETVIVSVRLPADAAQRIDERAGPNKRGEWIRRLIANELRKPVTTSPPNPPSKAKSQDVG
jgi:hypothetical protein